LVRGHGLGIRTGNPIGVTGVGSNRKGFITVDGGGGPVAHKIDPHFPIFVNGDVQLL